MVEVEEVEVIYTMELFINACITVSSYPINTIFLSFLILMVSRLSSFTLWPILLLVNELPYRMRYCVCVYGWGGGGLEVCAHVCVTLVL